MIILSIWALAHLSFTKTALCFWFEPKRTTNWPHGCDETIISKVETSTLKLKSLSLTVQVATAASVLFKTHPPVSITHNSSIFNFIIFPCRRQHLHNTLGCSYHPPQKDHLGFVIPSLFHHCMTNLSLLYFLLLVPFLLVSHVLRVDHSLKTHCSPPPPLFWVSYVDSQPLMLRVCVFTSWVVFSFQIVVIMTSPPTCS